MTSRSLKVLAAVAVVVFAAVFLAARTYWKSSASPASPTFASPEAAVEALGAAVAKGSADDMRALFGAEGEALVDTSEPIELARNREVFKIAMAEGWRLEDHGEQKTLVVGNEAWPFPVPLVRNDTGWRFDTAAGEDEILSRRIGRNELTAIRVCHTYVAAQRIYARRAHDDRPAGVFASVVRSDPGRENGLFWPAVHGRPRSPFGELLVEASDDARTALKDRAGAPFYGYYFRILTAQGAAAPGGARDYVVNGVLSGGFALVAWPAEYDVTGVMTFIVNQDGVVHQRDFGPDGEAAIREIHAYDPDSSWAPVE